MNHAERLLDIYQRALQRIDLTHNTAAAFSTLSRQPCAILAVGKSAGAMLEGAVRAFAGAVPRVAILPDGALLPSSPCQTLWTAHPLPDARVVASSRRALELAALSTAERPLWLCLSGGGSACLGAPLAGNSVATVAHVTQALMLAGADIRTLNTVRKHACDVLGGRLGAVARGLEAAVCVDIAEEDVTLVASGPASADATTAADAKDILARFGLPASLQLHASPVCPSWPHTAVAAPSHWRAALAAAAGTQAHVVGSTLQTAAAFSQALLEPVQHQGGTWVAVGEIPFAVPPGAPAGGRAAHLALWTAHQLMEDGRAFAILCAGSDGRDGPTDHAGACVTAAMLQNVSRVQVETALQKGAAHPFLQQRGALIPRQPSTLNLLDAYLCWRET